MGKEKKDKAKSDQSTAQTKEKKSTASPSATKKPSTAKKQPVKKTSTRKVPIKKAKKSETSHAFTDEEIALEAYFIAEERYRTGRHGSPHDDWVEAQARLRNR